MSSIDNLLLSLQLSILEKIDGKDPIVSIVKEGNSLFFENKLGKTFIVDIPKGEKGDDCDEERVISKLLERLESSNLKKDIIHEFDELIIKQKDDILLLINQIIENKTANEKKIIETLQVISSTLENLKDEEKKELKEIKAFLFD